MIRKDTPNGEDISTRDARIFAKHLRERGLRCRVIRRSHRDDYVRIVREEPRESFYEKVDAAQDEAEKEAGICVLHNVVVAPGWEDEHTMDFGRST